MQRNWKKKNRLNQVRPDNSYMYLALLADISGCFQFSMTFIGHFVTREILLLNKLASLLVYGLDNGSKDERWRLLSHGISTLLI